VSGAGIQSNPVPVTLSSDLQTVTISPPAISLSADTVANAATLQAGGVTPGEIVTILGSALGPADLPALILSSDGGNVTPGDTQVLFDGVVAPVFYSGAGRLSVIVPYEVAGHDSTQLQIQQAGQTSAPVTIPVVASTPGLFTQTGLGSGPAWMFNQDGMLNSSELGAPRGSVVTLYGTGEGQTIPEGVDGQVNTSAFPAPALPVSVTIGGENADLLYAAAAPNVVAGVLKIDARVPMSLQPGNQVPVVVTVGQYSSRRDVTMTVLGPDGRNGRIAYINSGPDGVRVKVLQPDQSLSSSTRMPGGTNFYLSSASVGNDWGIQVDDSPVRVVGQVCNWRTLQDSSMIWQCTGNAAMPFPR
jgi:uncharacterized protein (TIGR03437 family)